MIDDLVHDLDLAGAEVPLEIGGIILRVPQAEFDAGKNGELRRLFAAVGHLKFPYLQRLTQRHEITGFHRDFLVARTNDGIAHAVTTLVMVELGARRLPGRRPELTGLVVAEIKVAPADIERRVIVAIARQPAQACVTIKGITAGRVGNNPEIRFATEVIDPWQRSLRLVDDVFPLVVVEMSKTHSLVQMPKINRWQVWQCPAIPAVQARHRPWVPGACRTRFSSG